MDHYQMLQGFCDLDEHLSTPGLVLFVSFQGGPEVQSNNSLISGLPSSHPAQVITLHSFDAYLAPEPWKFVGICWHVEVRSCSNLAVFLCPRLPLDGSSLGATWCQPTWATSWTHKPSQRLKPCHYSPRAVRRRPCNSPTPGLSSQAPGHRLDVVLNHLESKRHEIGTAAWQGGGAPGGI